MLLITLLLIPLIGIFIISTIGAGAKASASYSDNGDISSTRSANGYSKPLLFVIGVLLSNSIKVPVLFIASKLDLLYIYVIVGALVAILVSTVLHILSCNRFIKLKDLLQIFVLSLGVGLIFFFKFKECGFYSLIEAPGAFGRFMRNLYSAGALCCPMATIMYNRRFSDHKAIAFKSDLGNSGNNKAGADSSTGSNKSSEIPSSLKAALIESSKRHPFALYSAQLACTQEINRLKLERTLPNADLNLIDTSIQNLEEGMLSVTKIITENERSSKNNE